MPVPSHTVEQGAFLVQAAVGDHQPSCRGTAAGGDRFRTFPGGGRSSRAEMGDHFILLSRMTPPSDLSCGEDRRVVVRLRFGTTAGAM